MKKNISSEKNLNGQGVSRRFFLQFAGMTLFTLGSGCYAVSPNRRHALLEKDLQNTGMPASRGYLLVDPEKCQGCMTCMLACSLANEGVHNLSYSRIQIVQNPFERFPVDVRIAQCRQCLSPLCVSACPTEALFVDADGMNVRRVDPDKCVGCGECMEACPYTPSRTIVHSEDDYARKCDLCLASGFCEKHDDYEIKQACVSACPVAAISYSEQIPPQRGPQGYQTNLRGRAWKKLRFPVK